MDSGRQEYERQARIEPKPPTWEELGIGSQLLWQAISELRGYFYRYTQEKHVTE